METASSGIPIRFSDLAGVVSSASTYTNLLPIAIYRLFPGFYSDSHVCSFLRASLLLFCIFGIAGSIQAQQPVLSPQDTASSRFQPQVEPPDTSPVMYMLCLHPERSIAEGDTMPDNSLRMYDASRTKEIDWATLGNLGSSAHPLFFESRRICGFNTGINVFDLYRKQAEDLRFYQTRRTFSQVFFSQGRNQDEGMLKARMSRNFDGGSNVSLDYRTINNLGEFKNQVDKHNSLSIGLMVPVGQRYTGFLIFSNNINRQKDNGGILTDTVFANGGLEGPVSAAIRLSGEESVSRLAEQSIHVQQFLNITGTQPGARVLRAAHALDWRKESFKYYDTKAYTEPDFWGDYLVDLRGLRNYLEVDRLDNALSLTTFKAKKPGQPSDELTVGARYSYIRINQDGRDSTVSNLFLNGSLAITPSERFAFVANGDLGMLKNFGEYHVSGTLTLGLGKAGVFSAGLMSQRYPAPFMASSLYISKQLFWRNSFDKLVQNMLEASYALPGIGFKATGRAHLVNNYIYFDQDRKPVQTGSPVQVLQLLVSENIKLGPVHLDNTFALQQLNRSDVIRLPKWFTKNSLYYSGDLFKHKMTLEGGCDFRMNSAFQPDAYMPLNWQFHLQDSISQQPYVWVDPFVSFKVQSFRFFVRYENLVSAWDKSKVFYQVAYHPQRFAALRFGISWRFMDRNLKDPNENTNSRGGSGSGFNGPPPGVGRG